MLSALTTCRKSFLLGAFLLTVLILLTYYPALFAGYVWDDLIILNDPRIQNAGGLWPLWRDIAHPITGDYWPVTYTSFWLECRLWGMLPLGYHATNIALHLANALLLFHLLRRLQMRGAFLAVALFAMHPAQISSVAWIAERKDLITTLFYFLAFWAWLRFEERETPTRYALTLLCFVFSMLCKSMSITWPVAVAILVWYRTGRIGWRLIVRLFPFLILGLFFAFWGSIFVPSPERMKLEVLQKIILSGKNFAFYVGKLFWPVEHLPLYPRWTLDTRVWSEYLCVLATLAGFVALWLLRRRMGRGVFAALAFYAATLFPILGFVVWSLLTKTVVQDHYQYVASIGPFLLLGYAVETCVLRTKCAWLYPLVGAIILLPSGVLAQRHVRLYQNQETLFQCNYEKYPTIEYAAFSYALGLAENGKHQKSLAVLNKTLSFYPQEAELWIAKGGEHLLLNQTREGVEAYQRAYALNPAEVGSLSEVAIALLYDDALNLDALLPQLEEAHGRVPQDIRLTACLATALSLKPERVADAQNLFAALLRQIPPTQLPPVALYHYGKLLLKQGDAASALTCMRAAQQRARRQPPSWQASILQAEQALKRN